MNTGIPIADASWFKYLQVYRRPFSTSKSNEKWTHVTLTFYNESEKPFYMKWLIMDRLTRPGWW